jgi:hypothetical protein
VSLETPALALVDHDEYAISDNSMDWQAQQQAGGKEDGADDAASKQPLKRKRKEDSSGLGFKSNKKAATTAAPAADSKPKKLGQEIGSFIGRKRAKRKRG